MHPFSKSLPGQFQYILDDIRAGVSYPDRWPEKKPAKSTTRKGQSKGAQSAKKGQ